MLWGMQGAWWNRGARCCRLFSRAMFQRQRGLIMTSTDGHLTDIKCKLVYCVNIYSVYSNYLWKLDTAACMELFMVFQIASDVILIRSNKMQQMQVFITAKLLYMFRASIDPIIRSTSNCNYSFCYMSYCRYKSFELEV